MVPRLVKLYMITAVKCILMVGFPIFARATFADVSPGANLNAQIGLTNPATCGGDVCHMNLHKTFAMWVTSINELHFPSYSLLLVHTEEAAPVLGEHIYLC